MKPPKVRVIDDFAPEGAAMLQALYSRSAESVDVHVEKVQKTGSAKFMQSYYVGYNHKSIADCGSTTVFVEGVSLLAAKAIQDWPLYSGQETSTRYIDMGKQPIVDPIDSPESNHVLDLWMSFYQANQLRAVAALRARYPRRDGEKEETYERAIKARAFDVLRGFLPAGVTTQLSWHTNLRQASDHLAGLARHALSEVQGIANCVSTQLAERYPSSGFDRHLAGVSGVDDRARDQRDRWESGAWATVASYPAQAAASSPTLVLPADAGWLRSMSGSQRTLVESRPRGCVLPHFYSDLGQFALRFLLDFGSFRDVQRHRNGVCRMPMLTTDWGFEPWYLNQLGDDFAVEALALISRQAQTIAKITDDPKLRQYYAAIGFRVPCHLTYALPALLYVLELRTSKTVHPTLREKMVEFAKMFAAQYPTIAFHPDLDPDDWTVRRGEQTIVAR